MSTNSKKLVLVLGIRPDIIRASLFINLMRKRFGKNFILVWSGQHYSDNLKDVFFRELNVDAPDVDLAVQGTNDAELVGDLIPKLFTFLQSINPMATIFLGDTNTVASSVAAAQLNIPILHIEGCMRSYNWEMPEEKYRKITDHLSDTIFAYLPEYKEQGLAEGIPAKNIEVVGNPIVDVLQEYFLSGKFRLSMQELESIKSAKYGINPGSKFALMTCHRRENVENESNLRSIFKLAQAAEVSIAFPAGYRTQASIKKFNIKIPENVSLVDPVGYLEILELLQSADFALTDSGTLVEEACIIGTPSIQMRHSTERPQVYAWKSSVKFDPSGETNQLEVLDAISKIEKNSWQHGFGNGTASNQIFASIVSKYECGSFSSHQPELYEPWSKSSYASH